MKGIEVTLDGVKYFVTVERQVCGLVDVTLFLGSLRSKEIYQEVVEMDEGVLRKFDVKKAKKFIIRSFEKK